MLEDIFKIPNLKKVFERAVMINGYIYNRALLLNMMRQFTGQRDMVRPGKTRFATAYLTLRRFHTFKNNLRNLFTSDEFKNSKFSRERAGQNIVKIIIMPSFWNNIRTALLLSGPLIKVLRLVDGEKKPAMGYIYEAMDRAKEAIAASFNNDENHYKKVFEIIDHRWEVQLHRPLHAAAHYLNPSLFYSNPSIKNDAEVLEGLYECIQKLAPSIQIADQLHIELMTYARAEGLFKIPSAVRHRTLLAPGKFLYISDYS